MVVSLVGGIYGMIGCVVCKIVYIQYQIIHMIRIIKYMNRLEVIDISPQITVIVFVSFWDTITGTSSKSRKSMTFSYAGCAETF